MLGKLNVWYSPKEIYFKYRKVFCIGWSIFFIFAFVGYFMMTSGKVDPLKFIEGMSDQLGGVIGQGTQLETLWGILSNNFVAALSIIVIGFIPVPFFYYFTLIINGFVVGVVIGVTKLVGISAWATIVGGLLPHGILELSIIILAVAMASVINKWVIQHTWGNVFKDLKKQKVATLDSSEEFLEEVRPLTFNQMLLPIVNQFIIYVTLGLFIAAVIETYITPITLGLFVH